MRRSNDFLPVCMLAAALGCALSSTSLAAEAPAICTEGDKENPDDCSKKIEDWVNNSGPTKLTEAAVAPLVKNEAAKLNTGPSGVAVGSGASTTNDYIPFLQALLGVSPSSGTEGDNLGLEFSNFGPLPDVIQYKASVQLLGSKLYEPLTTALDEASLQDQKSTLEDQVTATDDLSFSISVSRSSESTGRSPEPHADLFHGLLQASVKPNARKAAATLAFNSMLANIAERTKADADPANRFTQGRLDAEGFKAVPAEDRDKVIVAYEEMELASHASLALIRENLKAAGFYDALELLSNNPQWSFIANYRSRDELAGPDEWNATFKYEIGWPNLQQAKRDTGCANDSCLAGKFSTFLVSRSTKRTRNASPRFSFNLSYSQRARYDYALPDSTFSYSTKAAKSLTGGLSYGMYLSGTPSDPNRMRIDISATYEDVSEDPAKNDRGLLNATLTYPVGNGTFLSIGAVYATRPEYRGEVDKELSARAGLLYKFAGT